MVKYILLCVSIVVSAAMAAPMFKDGNGLEIRKYRFSRHTDRGFERLVIEFDHLGTDGTKPDLKTESLNHEAKITVGSAHLSGVIPESEINRSYLTNSRLLGAISISAEKSSFRVVTSLKKSATVEAFWLEKPARLVVDVFPVDRAAFNATSRRRVASNTPKPASVTTHESTTGDVYCFPAGTQLQATVGFGKKEAAGAELAGTGNGADTLGIGTTGTGNGLDGSENSIVCFPSTARLLPQISFKLAPYPASQLPGNIQTDLIGGSQKFYGSSARPPPQSPAASLEPILMQPVVNPIVNNFPAPSTVSIPPTQRAPVTTSLVPAATVAEPAKSAGAAVPNGEAVATTSPSIEVRSPSSVGPETPDAMPATPGATSEPLVAIPKDLPVTTGDIVAPPVTAAAGDAAPGVEEQKESSDLFPAPRKKKKKRAKPRLPQLPDSIKEGALLPPVK